MINKFQNMRKLNNLANNRGGLCMTIVNTEANGKRITLSPALIESIGTPNSVDIFKDADSDKIFVVPSENGLPLRKGGTIYNSFLVTQLAIECCLDFASQTSYSFHDIIIHNEENCTYAEATIKSEQNIKPDEGDNV